MQLFRKEETKQTTVTRQRGGSIAKRLLSMALALAMLAELCGTGPSFLLSRLVTEANAASGITYLPGTLNAAVLPREEVFSLAQAQRLEADNPTTVGLDINNKFAHVRKNAFYDSYNKVLYSDSCDTNVIYSDGNTGIGSELTGNNNWRVTYEWNPDQNSNAAQIRNHLLNQAADLEVFWSGSYTNSDKGQVSATVWYHGNHLWSTGFAGANESFTEQAGGEFTYGAPGVTRIGKTDAIPLAYTTYFEYSTWEPKYDSKGNPMYLEERTVTVTDPKTGQSRTETWMMPKTFEHPHTDYHTVVVGCGRIYRPRPLNYTGSRTIPATNGSPWFNVTLSGAQSSKISNTRMRLRDNAAPFLNSIRLQKNGADIDGNVYIKNNDVFDIVLVFNEDIRFSDNMPNDHDLKLKLTFVDTSKSTSDSDSWIEAYLVKLEGQTMTFRFDKNSKTGKTLPDEFYLDGLTASAQTGWFSSTADFPLSLINWNGATVTTGSNCCGVVTDLAGNPFEKFNITRFDGDARAYFDTKKPTVYRTSMWTTNLSEGEAALANNINEIDPAKLFLKDGDKVGLKVIFSEEMYSSEPSYNQTLLDEHGNELDPTVTLNITENGEPVTMLPRRIYNVDSKSIAVDAGARQVTVIEYREITINKNMAVDGSIRIVDINDLEKVSDKCVNLIEDTTFPQPPCQQKIDVTPPTITFGAAVPDGYDNDPDVFTIPIDLDDGDGSGVAGSKLTFRLLNEYSNAGYLWMVDDKPAIVKRESDGKTADTSGWGEYYALNNAFFADRPDRDFFAWVDVTPPVNASRLYLHIKMKDPTQWSYSLSSTEAGESENTFKTVYGGQIEYKTADAKGNRTSGTADFTHSLGHNTESTISFGGVTFGRNENNAVTMTIPVTVSNPIGVQRVVSATSESAVKREEYAGDLEKSYSFDVTYELDILNNPSGTVTLYVAAYGPSGKANANSTEYSYNYETGTLTYKTNLGDETAPLFGLPTVTNMEVTDGNRTMVLIDKGDGTFYATTGRVVDGKNLFADDSGVTWYHLTGTAAADYSSLTVTSSVENSTYAIRDWLLEQYGKVTFVLLNQNDAQTNSGDIAWADAPGSYIENSSIVKSVEYAYLANDSSFAVSTGVSYSKYNADGEHDPVPANVLSGNPSEPHSDISDYIFTATLANNRDDPYSDLRYGLRIVESAEAELFYNDGTGYRSVRVVSVPVGGTTQLCFNKADCETPRYDETTGADNSDGDPNWDGSRSGWYKVVFRYTVNGATTETTIAEDVYLDDTCSITPDVVSYNRTFKIKGYEPMWRYGTYFYDYSWTAHDESAAKDDDIEDGEIVKIGLAPLVAPDDMLPNWTPESYMVEEGSNGHYYWIDDETNVLTFDFSQKAPDAGSVANSRIGGENLFYAWSGNDPNGRANARASAQTFSVSGTVTLTVTACAEVTDDETGDTTFRFVASDYEDGCLPLTEGYNLIHYVVEYEDGEFVEKTFMADVRTKAMELGLDVYYHAADTYITEEQMTAAWQACKTVVTDVEELVYDTLDDFAASQGAVRVSGMPLYDQNNNTIADGYYVVVGAKCTDEADLYHRNEAVVNPELNDYDYARAVSFTSYRHLEQINANERSSAYETPKLSPMADERFRSSSDNELFYAEDVYGNVSFATLPMPSIDGNAPELSVASNFAEYSFGDIVRSWSEWNAVTEAYDSFYTNYAFLLNLSDDHPLDVSGLTVTFDPAYSKVLDPSLNGTTDRVTMKVPLNFEKDELGYFLPWEISGNEAGTTGGITMTCLKTLNDPNYKNYPNFHDIIGLEVQGSFKPGALSDDVVMTFEIVDAFGNKAAEEVTFRNKEGYGINQKSFALRGGVSDNYGWYEGYTEWDANGDPVYPYRYPFMAELPDNVPAFEFYYAGYYEGGDWFPDYNKPIYFDGSWFSREDVRNVLPEADQYGVGKYFTNEGYVKVGVVSEGRETEEYAEALPVALSIESYQTDNGVFTDGYVRTRTIQKHTNFISQGSYYWTEQAIILPSVTENGNVTVNWTDVFGVKHENTVAITAFEPYTSDDLTVHTSFSPATQTNQDVLVTIKGDRIKNTNESGETVSTRTAKIAGVTVTLRDGTTFDETDERVTIYDAQPWNATVLMPDNGTVSVKYRYPDYSTGTDEAAEAFVREKIAEGNTDFDWIYNRVYENRSKLICVSTIDNTPPTPTVSYVFTDTGEAVPEDIAATTREIRADVTADELIESVEGGLSRTFTYGAAEGDKLTLTVRDRAGNTVPVTVTCPAAITAPTTAENNPPTATVYLSAVLGTEAKSIGTFTLYENSKTVTSIDDEGNETTETVNLNAQTVADINAALAKNPATFYKFRFEINDEAPAACTLSSSNAEVANVGAQNTVDVRVNGSFNLYVTDNANNASSLNGIVVSKVDTEAPKVTPEYSVYSKDGSPRVRVAFKAENDETIYPIVTGDMTSRDILSTIYRIFDQDGNVVGRQTGFFVDFETNEDYTFYYKDVYGNASSITVQIRGIDTEAPSFLSTSWSGTINNMTPDTEGAGPTNRNVTATLKTDKDVKAVELYYFDKDAEGCVGEPLSPSDASKLRATLTPGLIELTWTDNLNSKIMLKAIGASNNLAKFTELPAVTVIDRAVPTVTPVSSAVSADKSSKDFRFTVSGAEGEKFTSNLAVTYTTQTVGETEIVTRNAVGVKGTVFIYTAKSKAPVTLRFIDDAGNTAEFQITEDMLSDIDLAPLTVRYNTAASELGAASSPSSLTLTDTSLYICPSKNATVTLTADSVECGTTELPKDVWTLVTLASSADIQTLMFTDTNTGKVSYAWLAADTDRSAPILTYTGDSTVFADEEMTPAQISALLLADVSAFDAGEPLDYAAISVDVPSTAAGLHTVTYNVSDAKGNVGKLERYLYVKGRYDPVIRVNGRETVPLGTIFLETKTLNITASCALTGDNSVYLAIRPGIMTAARMKYSTVSGTNSLSYTPPKDGFYTVLARNRDRTEVLTYIYIENAVDAV